MTEAKFISSIDCCFPYASPVKARALARKALSLTPNAVFMVYHELARPGRGVRTSRSARLALLDYLEERFVHPLSGLASWLTRNMIAGRQISVAQAAAAALRSAKFPDCYNILNLAYFACDDVRGKNEALFDSIRRKWEQEMRTSGGSGRAVKRTVRRHTKASRVSR